MEINRTDKTLTISQNTGITFSVAFFLMIAGALISGASWVTTTQARIENTIASVKDNRAEINALKAQSNEQQIQLTEINAKTSSIDANVLELKEWIKDRENQ